MARKKLTLTEVRRALRKVRAKLLDGTIAKKDFDMGIPWANPGESSHYRPGGHCGSIGCIGGYMAFELDPKGVSRDSERAVGLMRSAASLQENLHDLFFVFGAVKPITRRHAALAITRALDGAPEPWLTRARR